MNIDEILTGVIGFAIAMALVGAAIAGIIYGYYIYAQHQTLTNYLWPIAEAVPAKGGGYYLAVINTGHEPFIIKYLIYPNGQSQRVHTKPLYHNQYWLKHLDQLPAEVMVCSAVDPKVCTTAPVHGWYVVNTNATTLTGPNNVGENQVIVIVDDPNNAGWQVNWHDTAGVASGSQSGSTSTGWVIGNLPSNDEVNLWATLTSTPSGYSCTITPQSTTATPGQVVLFNINCQQQQSQPPSSPPTGSITVTVNDQYGAGWSITWSDTQGVVSGSQAGSNTESWTITGVPSGDAVNLQASITQNPPGYSCTITPTSATAYAGGSVTFTVSCTATGAPTGSITVTVTNDSLGATWLVTWSDSQGVVSGSQSGSSDYSWVISNVPYNDVVYLTAQITSSPTGYTCTISPQSTSAQAGQSVTFTIDCYSTQSSSPSPPPTTGSITVIVTNDTQGAGWEVTWSDTQGAVSGSQSGSSNMQWTINNVPSGDTVNFNAQITSNPSGYTCSISPTTTSAQAGGSVTFTVSCTSNTGSISVTVQDSYGAGWKITWSDTQGVVSGSQSGSSTTSWSISNVPSGDTVNFQASITSVPTGYSSCSISPSTTSAGPGQSVTFTVTCQVETGSINVSVNDTYNAGWEITWTDTKGVVNGSQTGSSSTQWTVNNVPYGDTVTFQASITSTPSGYSSCSINPQSTTAQMGQSVTFTVTCTKSTTQTGSITVSVTNDTLGAVWEVQWSDTQGIVSGSQANTTDQTWVIKNVPYGDTVTLTATIVSNPSDYTCTISPSQTTAQAGNTVTFTINCVVKTGSISVSVQDNYGAGWQVTWSDTQGVVSGSQSGSGNSQWTITNVPYTDSVTFNAKIISNPQGYTCTISPTSTTAQAGQSITFTVSCTVETGAISVSVTNDSLGATWLVTWSDSQGVVSGSQSGSSDASWTVNNVPYGDSVTFQAQIVSNPSGYTCTISPTSQTAQMGGSVTFTVSCTLITGSINVEVTNDTLGATWNVTWSDTKGVISGSQSGSSDMQWTISNVPYGDTVNFQASITNNPPGYACSITPSSTSAQMGGSVTFTVTCQKLPGITVIVNDTYGAGWEIQWSLSASGSKTGDTSEWFQVQATGTVYFQAWITSTNGYSKCSISPSSTSANPGQTVTFTVSCTGSGGTVVVDVQDSYGAGWQIQYYDQLDLIGQHTVTGSSSESWTINVPSGDDLVFYSSITSVPSGYTSCGIYPTQTSVGPIYSGQSQTVTFTVVCSTLPPISVTVNDQDNAGWQVTWSGAVSGSLSGYSSNSWSVVVPTNSAETFNAQIISNPSGYTCTISPSQTTAYPGQSITFNVNCQKPSSGGGGSGGSGNITVTVNDNYGAGWQITWSGGASGSKSGSTSETWVITASSTVNFNAQITSTPSGYSYCSINPSSASANPGGSVTFTVTCSTQPPPSYYCFFTLSVGANPSGADSGVSPLGTTTYQLAPGQSVSGSISAQSSVPGNSQSNSEEWYQFEDWLLTYSGTGIFYFNGVQISSGSKWNYAKTSGNYEYECPSSLSQNVTATFTATANYYSDYVTITGSESITVSGSGTYDASYKLSWSVNPYSASYVKWTLSTGNPFSITGYLYDASGTLLGQAGENPRITCQLPNGGYAQPINITESFSPTSLQTSLTQSVSGSTGSTTVTVYISYTCPSNNGW